MAQYTAPHSLPIIEPTVDRIKDAAKPSALAADINALAAATNAAISIEGGRAEAEAKAVAIAAASADATAKTAAVRTEARIYTDQVVNTSHLALDTDGTPYFQPGSMTYRIFMDTDGNPYFREA